MINNIRTEFIKFIKYKELINIGDKIVVGLSGGPDSVALLNLLISIKEEFKLEIVAAHINHMLRGIEADEDEEFARKLCQDLNIVFYSKKVDCKEFAKKKNVSEETAGREIRYSFFNEVMVKCDFNKIATAHNANDQAETIIMRLMRGTGLEGLCGIPVIREGKYIRPILFMEREEIESYCREINIEPKIDKSNLENIYSRNKVRLDIIPYMKNNFNNDVINSINRMGSLLMEDSIYILNQVEIAFKDSCIVKDNMVTIKNRAKEYDLAIYRRIIRKAIKSISGSNYDVEMKHIEDIVLLQKSGTGKGIDLPNGLIARNVYGDIEILKGNVKIDFMDEEIEINKSMVLHKELGFGKYNIEFQVINNSEHIAYDKNSLIKYFDFDKINGNIVIRYRKNGDKITPFGINGTKKIKDIFIDLKVPKEVRDTIPIVQFDEEISWVVGIKISNNYKIDKNTRKILKIHFKERN